MALRDKVQTLTTACKLRSGPLWTHLMTSPHHSGYLRISQKCQTLWSLHTCCSILEACLHFGVATFCLSLHFHYLISSKLV